MQFEIAKKRYPGYLEAFGATNGSTTGAVKGHQGWQLGSGALFPYLEQEPVYELWADPSYYGSAWNTGSRISRRNERW